MNRTLPLTLAALLVVSVVAATAGVGTVGATSDDGADGEAYAGSTVEFAVDGQAIADYAVDGQTTFTEVSVQSQSEADAGAGADVGVGVEAAADIEGAALSTSAQTETHAEIEAESGATLSAHDTDRGHLVVEAGDEDQFVHAEVDTSAQASADGDAVVVENGEREGAFVVVGEGEVAVTDDGHVAADLESDSTLVFRSDEGERDDQTRYEEQLIADGSAAAEVYVGADGDEVVSEAATFGQETAAEASAEAENQVELTVERTTSEGTIVLTTVSEAAIGSVDDLDVTVDGETAVEAESQAELEAAADGDQPAYKLASYSEAEGEAAVYLAFDHFSERTATLSGADADDADGQESDDADDADETDDGSDDDETESVADSVPGFGALVALIAVAVAVAMRRHS